MKETAPAQTTLQIRKRLLGASAIVHHEPGARDISVELDVESFVRRLLLFDTYILYSVRLKEIPELVRHFGYSGTLELLKSGALEIRCDCTQFAEGFTNPPLPPLTFQFHVIKAHIRDQYLIDNLSEVNRAPAISAKELMTLKEEVVRAVRQPDNQAMFASVVAPAFESDVLRNKALTKSAARLLLAKQLGIRELDDFELHFEKLGDDRYRAETDLIRKLNLAPDQIHDAIKAALLGISGVDQRIGEMSAHTALS